MSTPADPRRKAEPQGAPLSRMDAYELDMLIRHEAEESAGKAKPADPRDALVASPHFEWTDGMRGRDDDDSVWAFVEREGDEFLFSRNGDRFLRWCDRGDMWPDIDHGGTQGEMLALARKAWGPEFEVHVSIYADKAEVVLARVDDAGWSEFVGATLGLVLTAALLAAPKKVGES